MLAKEFNSRANFVKAFTKKIRNEKIAFNILMIEYPHMCVALCVPEGFRVGCNNCQKY